MTPREALEQILSLTLPAGEDFGDSRVADIARRGLASGLFQRGDFTLSSGRKSHFKIECDALTDADWAALAETFFEAYGGGWGAVEGVPRGGLAFARHLSKYSMTREECLKERSLYAWVDVLVVDDVATTGNSLRGLAQAFEKQGLMTDCAVAFSRMNEASMRAPYPITAMFTTHFGHV